MAAQAHLSSTIKTVTALRESCGSADSGALSSKGVGDVGNTLFRCIGATFPSGCSLGGGLLQRVLCFSQSFSRIELKIKDMPLVDSKALANSDPEASTVDVESVSLSMLGLAPFTRSTESLSCLPRMLIRGTDCRP